MGKQLGNVNKAYVKVAGSSGGAAAYAWLAGEQSNSVNRTAEAIETSDKDNEWADFISGKKGCTVEITVFADKTDPAQNATLDALVEGTVIDWAVGELGSSSITDGDYGQGIVTAVNDSNDFGAVATRTISITATGAVTHA